MVGYLGLRSRFFAVQKKVDITQKTLRVPLDERIARRTNKLSNSISVTLSSQ